MGDKPSLREAGQLDLESIAQIAAILYPSNFNGKGKDPLTESRAWVAHMTHNLT